MRIAALAVVMLIPAEMMAQLAGGLSVGSGFGQLGGGAWMRESRLAPSLQFANPHSALRFDGLVAERTGAISLDRATLSALAATPSIGPLRLSIEGGYRHDIAIDRLAIADVAPSLSMKAGRVGAWFGSRHQQRAAPMLQAGVWGSVGSAVLSVSSQTQSSTTMSIQHVGYADSARTDSGWVYRRNVRIDTTSSSAAYNWAHMEARIDWSYRRLALSGSVATRVQGERRRDSTPASSLNWGRVNAAFLLNQRLSLIAAAGTYPAAPGARSSVGARFATFGVRFSPAMLLREPLPAPVRPAASAFSIRQVEPGLYKLVFRVPSARTVEISGDFNRWSAVAMTQTAPDMWEATLPLASGTHRLNVRVDGDRWTAPPGLPAVNDEFSGRVGILVIR